MQGKRYKGRYAFGLHLMWGNGSIVCGATEEEATVDPKAVTCGACRFKAMDEAAELLQLIAPGFLK